MSCEWMVEKREIPTANQNSRPIINSLVNPIHISLFTIVMSSLYQAVSSSLTTTKDGDLTSVDIQSTEPWTVPDPRYVGKSAKAYWYKQVFTGDYDADAIFHYVENRASTAAGHTNAFYSMFDIAYANHGQVVLTPDDVWTCISVQFAKYVEANAEALRDLFVSFSGKEKIVIDMDSVNYELFMTKVVDQISKRTKGDVTESLKFDFSTSTAFDHTMGHLSTMTAMKQYFSYGMRLCCGIQRVHFTGTLEDWQNLRQKTARLIETYHLDNAKYFKSFKAWGKDIDNILNEFIETYQGRVNLEFWNGVLDLEIRHGSGATTKIHGWIVKLISNERVLEVSNIPSGGFEVPVEINNNGAITNVKIVGGFSGLAISGTGLIRTQRSYAVINMSIAEELQRKKDLIRAEINQIRAEEELLHKSSEPFCERIKKACSRQSRYVDEARATAAGVLDEYNKVKEINTQVYELQRKINEKEEVIYRMPGVRE